MVDITRKKARPVLICELCDPAPDPEEDSEPMVESEGEEPEPEDEFVSYIETVRKIQESLDSISFNLGSIIDMQVRNVYTLPAVGNRLRRLRDQTEGAAGNEELLEQILSQGDNRNVEEFLSLVQQNVIVNVNLSYYFKIMLVMLTVNTLLLVKCLVWDPFV